MSFLRSIRGKRPDQQVPDQELLGAYQQDKNLQALADLYERYMDLVYGLCLNYMDSESAQDAVMAIFEVLVRDLLKPYPVTHFKSWLYKVARNHCLQQLRSPLHGKIVELGPDLMQSGEELHLNTALESEETRKRLEKCIEALPDGQRRMVTMFYLEDKCYKEIETLTGYEWNKVRSNIQNARRNLKICLERKMNVPKGVQ
jgi:RNA polymerase sigma factor (sigma-70 family)